MTDAGMLKINEAKQNGQWDKKESDKNVVSLTEKLSKVFKKNDKAFQLFNN